MLPRSRRETGQPSEEGTKMKMRFLVIVAGLHLGLTAAAYPQSAAPDPYVTGLVLISNTGCPVIVGSVWPKSPAEAAGIRVGDRLLQIDGTPVAGMGVMEAGRALRSETGTTVMLKVWSRGSERSAALTREKRSVLLERQGKKVVAGIIVDAGTTEAEIRRVQDLDANLSRRTTARVFPLHYPADTTIYYAGFELFVLREPDEVVVGGIEDGPASRAGIQWGDQILSVNGLDPNGKSAPELERMFSRTAPERMQLRVQPIGKEARVVDITLERASDILKANGNRIVNGKLVPSGVTPEDAACLTRDE